MTNLHNLTVAQLHQVVAIKVKIEELQNELNAIAGGESAAVLDEEPAVRSPGRPKKRHMSPSARARIGAAQKKRWAKVRRGKKASAEVEAPVKKKRKRRVDAATRARLSAMAKARWANAKASGRSRL